MKLKRVLSLFLACVCVIFALSSCKIKIFLSEDGKLGWPQFEFGDSDESRPNGDEGRIPVVPGERPADGSWKGVDFGGQTLKVEISRNAHAQTAFPAADIYTRGPDSGTTADQIQKKVLTRNQKVEDELDIDIDYMISDLEYDKVLDHVEKYIRISSDDAPDVLHNDLYGLFRAMPKGYFWNVKNPGRDADGNEINSFFDFDAECWYTDFMAGCTFDENKQYLLASDYNIDLIRYAWVLFTNVDQFDYRIQHDPEIVSYASVVERIIATERGLSYDELGHIAHMAWIDSGHNKGVVELDDGVVGLCLNDLDSRIFLASCGLSMVEWSGGATGKGTPSVFPSNSEAVRDLATFSHKFCELYNSPVYNGPLSPVESVMAFTKGNVLLSLGLLGEMQTEEVKNVSFERGILPVSSYDTASPLRVSVGDQAEITVILENSDSFTMASAYFQFLSEESSDILTEYYTRGLGFGETSYAYAMAEFIKEHISSPFESVGVGYLCDEALASQIYNIVKSDAVANKNSFLSEYDSAQGMYEAALGRILAQFANLD